MTGFTNYARRFYLIFLMGTLFGKFMEDSGAARSIAHAIMKAHRRRVSTGRCASWSRSPSSPWR